MINKEVIEIRFSDEYEKMLKRSRITTLFVMVPAFIVLIVIKAPIRFMILMVLLLMLLTLIAFWSRLIGEGNLTTKVRIDNNGIYAWKRNKKEVFVPWENVNEIRIMDKKTPDDYLLFYKKKKGFSNSPDKFGYCALALDNNAAQIAKEKLYEYNTKHGKLKSIKI